MSAPLFYLVCCVSGAVLGFVLKAGWRLVVVLIVVCALVMAAMYHGHELGRNEAVKTPSVPDAPEKQ